jgi:branched-chain amino acid transport system permease protein
MFSQAAYLAVLYFGDITRGDEGIVIKEELRRFDLAGVTIDLADPVLRYNLALAFMAIAIALSLVIVRSRIGHVLVAIRENESRTTMLGYDTARYKLLAFAISGTFAAASGAAYALMFAYAGATLASIQYSIHPLLWTLLGGAATVLGPVLGTGLMFVLVDLASSFTNANLLMVGAVLIALVLFFPKGILGTLRERYFRWLP